MADFIWRADTYRALVLPLNSAGAPNAISTACFEGFDIEGVQDFTPNNPNPRAIPGIAQGRVRDTIYLPSLEAQTAVMHALFESLAASAALQGVKNYQVGLKDIVPYNTDMQGQEPDVALMVSALVTHDEDGNTVWNNYLMPRTRIMVNPAPMVQTASQYLFNIAISKAKKELWGVPLTVGVQGCTEFGMQSIVTTERLNVVAWLADGSEGDFLVPTGKQMVDPTVSGKAQIFDFTTGTELTANLTKDATGFHFAYGFEPTAAHLLVGTYEF